MRAILFLMLLSCLVVAGCGPSGPTVYRRNGTVTFDGKPVPLGKVYFEPDVPAGGSGPTGFADIVDGKYDTNAKNGKGSASGPVIVRVSGYSDQNKDAISGFGKPLFVEYESKTNLPANASEFKIEVPAAAAKGLPKTTVPLDP